MNQIFPDCKNETLQNPGSKTARVSLLSPACLLPCPAPHISEPRLAQSGCHCWHTTVPSGLVHSLGTNSSGTCLSCLFREATLPLKLYFKSSQMSGSISLCLKRNKRRERMCWIYQSRARLSSLAVLPVSMRSVRRDAVRASALNSRGAVCDAGQRRVLVG